MAEYEKKRRWETIFFTVCICVIVVMGIYINFIKIRNNRNISAALSENDRKNTISVYVEGEVMCPGEYKLKEGSRVGDAIEIAGGFTKNANKKINISVSLKNGSRVRVSKRGEDPDAGIDFKVNINTATVEEIETIDGIGEKTAEKIIEYREKNGGFSSPDDIMNVEDIGKATYEEIKNIIVTE